MSAVLATAVVLAQQQGASGGPSLFGWYLGFAIGFAVIVVVVVIVAMILNLASKISGQAQDAIEALDAGQNNSLPLWDVGITNDRARSILGAARKARKVVEG